MDGGGLGWSVAHVIWVGILVVSSGLATTVLTHGQPGPGITLTLQDGAEWNPAGLDNERIFTLEPYQDIPQQRVVRTGCRV